MQAGTVLINEVLLSSKQTWSCPGSTSVPGTTDNSWVELYNPLALSFNLYIVHAAIDGGPGTTAMYFPFGSAIAAHGFLTIFPDKSIIFPNGAPETLTRRLLFNGTIIDQVKIPSNLGDGQSYARISDGGPKWEITSTPTIGRSNVLPTPTPKAGRTPKAATIKKKSSSKISAKTTSSKTTSTHTGTTITGESTNPSVASGVQPAWSQLQLPSTASPLPTTAAATASPLDTTTTSPPANSTSGDVLRNVLLTGVAAAFVCALLWWWWRRRFTHP
jgi:hypothetical protein